MHARADYLHMLPGMLITGVGVGLTLPTLIATAVGSLPPTSFSTGSAVVTMARQIGSVFGIAILVAILDTGRADNAVAIFDRSWWFTAGTAGLAALASLALSRKPSRPSSIATGSTGNADGAAKAPTITGGPTRTSGRAVHDTSAFARSEISDLGLK
jgi:hypothetical protein